MSKVFNKLLLVFICLNLFALKAYATGDPIEMLSTVADETLEKIQKQKDAISKNDDILYNILETTVIPHVDFNEMALWIAGKKAWRGASQAQRNNFIKEFKILVLRTYSHFLLGVSDKQLSFERSGRSNGKRVQISGTIKRANGETIGINYRLVDVGQWKIYDIVVEGVSLLKGFQAQFSDRIRKYGMSSVIEEIEEHNKTKSKE